MKAFTEVINNESTSSSPEEANQTLQEYFSKQQEEMLNKNLETGIAFLEENSKKDNVVSLPWDCTRDNNRKGAKSNR